MKLSINPFDANENNKQSLYKKGLELVYEFLKINNIKPPQININNNIYCNGICYSTGLIEINLKKCQVATKTPQFKWSFPGYKADITPIGVLAHELGHYVLLLYANDKIVINELFKLINSKEKNITSYDKNNNYHEIFAESFKLFLTNPDLLKTFYPLRYNLIYNTMKLKPVLTSNYKEQFKYANKRYIEVLEKQLQN